MMLQVAILANDHQAHNATVLSHNATAVSGAGRPVHLVDLVHLVYLVGLVQPNKQDKPNKPNKRDRPDRPNRPHERDRPADCFSILVEMESGHGFHGKTPRSIHPASPHYS
jgi:hypothetical protein